MGEYDLNLDQLLQFDEDTQQQILKSLSDENQVKIQNAFAKISQIEEKNNPTPIQSAVQNPEGENLLESQPVEDQEDFADLSKLCQRHVFVADLIRKVRNHQQELPQTQQAPSLVDQQQQNQLDTSQLGMDLLQQLNQDGQFAATKDGEID